MTIAAADSMPGKPPATAEAARAGESPAKPGPPVVIVRGLGKLFRIYATPWDRVREWMMLGRGKPRHRPFWAVRGVDFDVARGECLGIIGANGSGKSTLLKMVAGAMYPTEGSCRIEGRALSLIELGTGLNPQLTGRDNIVHAATLLGFPPGYAKEAMAEIEAFAELGEFFDRPVMLYSSGMRVRLAFSMFACFRPEVFIVDEALSVGDVFFQQKCATRLKELLAGGMTLIFVSHDTGAVLNLCDRALLMERGRPVFLGSPQEAMSRYIASLGTRAPGAGAGAARWVRQGAEAAAHAAGALGQGGASDLAGQVAEIVRRDVIRARAEHRHGTGDARILGCRVTDERGQDTLRGLVGRPLTFHVAIEAVRDIESPRAGIRFFDRFNTLVFSAGTFQTGSEFPSMRAGERAVVRFEVTMDVQPEQYTFGLGVGRPAAGAGDDAGEALDRIDLLGPITVGLEPGARRPFYGTARLPMTVRVRTG